MTGRHERPLPRRIMENVEDQFYWQIKHEGSGVIPIPKREVKLIPNRKYRFDFVWEKEKIAVEIEGGIWMRYGGAHSRPWGILRDMEKSNYATRLGYQVYRFSTKDVKTGDAIRFIKNIFIDNKVDI